MDFEEQASGYSAVNAVFFAEASRLAYQDPGEVQGTVKEWGFDGDFTFFDGGGTQGFLATDATKVVLAFRGTQSDKLRDIAADAKFRKEPDAMGKIHRGFKDALDEVWDDVTTKVGQHPDKQLWIGGHSLGAALAVVAAARFTDAGREVAGVYPLGQPRVGNGSFVRAFNRALPNKCFRIVNHIDIVPRVPPLTFGFRHAKTRVYISRSGAVRVKANVWGVIVEGFGARARNPVSRAVGVDEHNTGEYIKRLRAAR